MVRRAVSRPTLAVGTLCAFTAFVGCVTGHGGSVASMGRAAGVERDEGTAREAREDRDVGATVHTPWDRGERDADASAATPVAAAPLAAGAAAAGAAAEPEPAEAVSFPPNSERAAEPHARLELFYSGEDDRHEPGARAQASWRYLTLRGATEWNHDATGSLGFLAWTVGGYLASREGVVVLHPYFGRTEVRGDRRAFGRTTGLELMLASLHGAELYAGGAVTALPADALYEYEAGWRGVLAHGPLGGVAIGLTWRGKRVGDAWFAHYGGMIGYWL